MKEKWILESLMSNTWLFEKIFWKLLDPLVRDVRRERVKNLLRNYWYEDVEFLFPRSLDKEAVQENLKIVMNYYKEEDEKKGILWFWKKDD